VLETVPELTDQVEPLIDGKAAELLAGELHGGMLAHARFLGPTRPIMGTKAFVGARCGGSCAMWWFVATPKTSFRYTRP
jgi:hypothetical protein